MQSTVASLRIPIMLIALLAAIGVSMLAMLGWARFGSSIFLTMAEGTLSWCL